MTATIALADTPTRPFYDPVADCSAMSSGGYMCTGRKGHTTGDLPHVAYGFISGCLAIWDDAGHEVNLDDHPAGTTLAAASRVTS